ncbi:MAG TPA: glycoside hydrolase family 76 protein [Cytophagales bacterium]|nr:glycoside hydrolase family 76 protein [Cytophagales bacterium]
MRYLPLFIFTLLYIQSTGVFSQKKSKSKTKKEVSSERNWAALADSLQEASYNTYLSSDKKYYIQDNAGETKFHYWWNAHALDVLVDGYNRTKDETYKTKMKDLVKGIKESNGGTYSNDFYDDMEWLALSSLRAYHATKDPEFLEVTNYLWKDIKTAQNDTMGGGLAWRKSQTYYKNTPANAPAIILAARLYKLNKNEADLKLAKELYSWLKKTLVNPETGFVMDGINREKNGKIDHWKLTYNQGVYIGAAHELYKLTGDKTYLNDAIKTADYVINDPEFVPEGILKSEGGGDGGLFKGILIRYLTLFSQEKDVPKENRDNYRKFINHNAKTLAEKGIKRPEMLVSNKWSKQPEQKTDYSTQLSGIMLIEAAHSLDKK